MMWKVSIGALLLLIGLTGCRLAPAIDVVPTTGDTAADPASAQNLLPDLTSFGYSSTSASSIQDAITATGGGAAVINGNPALSAAIAKIDEMINCYEATGSVAARIYTDANIGNLLAGELPRVGAVAVINRDRVARNLLACALNTNQGGFRAQSAEIEPCGGAGSVQRDGETLDFVYAATDPQLCQLFAERLR